MLAMQGSLSVERFILVLLVIIASVVIGNAFPVSSTMSTLPTTNITLPTTQTTMTTPPPIVTASPPKTPLIIAQAAPSTSTTPPPSTGQTINLSVVRLDNGFAYYASQNFGTPADSNTAHTQSMLRIFENGKELGPAHTLWSDISTIGQGRFVHWQNSSGVITLYFSASDNTNPQTNGRTYTYLLGSGLPPLPPPAPASVPPPIPTPTPAPASDPTPAPALAPSCSMGCFYVSPAGNDSNPGTQAQPWRTIGKAAAALMAGDTAIVMDGTYTEPEVQFHTSGTATQPITLKAANPHLAVLSSTSGCNPAFSISASYITIEDLRISVSPNNVTCTARPTSANCAIRAWNGNTPNISADQSTGNVGFTARGLLVDASAARDVGIKSNQDYALVENSDIHGSLEVFNAASNIFRNNTITGGDAWGDAISSKGGQRNAQIYNNIVHHTGNGSGIKLGGSSSCCLFDSTTNVEAYNTVAYNNVILNESGGTISALLGMTGCQDCTAMNNVVIGGQLFMGPSSPYGIGNPNPTFKNNIITCNGAGTATSNTTGWTGYWSGTLTVDYNDFYNCTSGVPSQVHAVTGNPLYVNAASDWHLQSGSPALGAGVEVFMFGFNGELIDVSRNKDGNFRTIPWNLGIY